MLGVIPVNAGRAGYHLMQDVIPNNARRAAWFGAYVAFACG
jgi:hypothetical protein